MSLRLTQTRTARASTLLANSMANSWVANALADRDDWVARVVAAGGTVSSGTQAAVLTFVRAIYAANLRGSFYRLNLFAGDSLAAALIPLFRSTLYGGTVMGSASDTNVNFVSADYAEASGLKGNGSSKYLNTGLTTEEFSNSISVHLAASGTSFTTGSAASLVGSYDGLAGSLCSLESALTVSAALRCTFRFGTFTDGQSPTTTTSATESHLIATRTAANAAAIYRGGSSVATSTTRTVPSVSPRAFFVFATSNFGGVANYNAARMTSYSIGAGLTASQVSAYSTALIAFNAALGR